MKTLILTASFLAASAGAAAAITSYLKPNDFWSESGRVTIEASYTGTFFTPQIALASDFAVIMPDGSNGAFDQIEIGGQSTQLASRLPDYGTYRFTSGERLGAVTTLVGVDGQWRPLAAGETPPEGAPTTTLQTVTVAEAYVTRGGPTRESVDRSVGRLALRPVTHPNQILVSGGLQVQLQFDGAPFPNMPLVLYSAGEPDTDVDRYFVTDASGVATITLDQPGQYVLAARHRASAPAGSEAAVRSYTTSLTFEALTELPTITEVREESESSRSRRRSTTRVGGIRN